MVLPTSVWAANFSLDQFSSTGSRGFQIVPITFYLDWSAPRVQIQEASRIDHVSITIDARFDNASDLAEELGIAAKSTQIETLAHAYLAWGEACAERLLGDFAFVLWDSQKFRLVAARDPFGVKPLYFRTHAGQVWISSQIEPLLSTFAARPSLDDRRVVEYLMGQYASPDATFFQEIHEIPPGHIVTMTSSDVTRRCYWKPRKTRWSAGAPSRQECWNEFRRLFVQSVRRRLSSSDPSLVQISGGLDSSSIACAADAVVRGRGSPLPVVRGVAGIYPGLPCDESAFIDVVARRVKFPVDRWDATESNDEDLFDPRIDEPGIRATFNSGTVGDIALAQVHGASVILSGFGGDQLGKVSGFVRDLFADGHWFDAIAELLFFPGASTSSRAGRIKDIAAQIFPREFSRWAARSVSPQWLSADLRPFARSLFSDPVVEIDGLSHVQARAWGRLVAPRTLRNVSVLNAQANHHGVEYRFPFLDADLIRFVMTIPFQYWPRPASYARLHREALRDFIPEEITDRFGKAEFTPALAARVRKSAGRIRDVFGGPVWASSRYVDRVEANRLWRKVTLDSGKAARSEDWRHVWAVATLEVWLRKLFGYYAGGSVQEAWSWKTN
jgi:asparagine synthase (glutamine-hydrolysing)